MRRWLTVFLLVLLPLQLSWAAAASYCQHERDAATQHFGHHQHQHPHAADGKDGGAAADTLAVLDADCAFCHLGCVKPVASVATLPGPAAAAVTWAVLRPDRHDFLLPERIERPNWRCA